MATGDAGVPLSRWNFSVFETVELTTRPTSCSKPSENSLLRYSWSFSLVRLRKFSSFFFRALTQRLIGSDMKHSSLYRDSLAAELPRPYANATHYEAIDETQLLLR